MYTRPRLSALVLLLLALVSLVPEISAADLPTPEWIWLDRDAHDEEVVLFRKEFDVDSGVKSAVLFGSCDNQLRVYLNGEDVAASEAWEAPAKEKVTKVVKKGRNLLAVRGMNRESAAGLLIRLDVELTDGRTQRVNTDATWLATGTQLPRGWQFTTYAPDSKDGWKKPFVIGKYGM